MSILVFVGDSYLISELSYKDSKSITSNSILWVLQTLNIIKKFHDIKISMNASRKQKLWFDSIHLFKYSLLISARIIVRLNKAKNWTIPSTISNRICYDKNSLKALLLCPPSNIYFQLVPISCMVTPSSCLIWQIIRLILPLNKYGCVYAWTTLGNIATLLWKSLVMLQNVCENCARIWRMGSTISTVCSLSCEKSVRNCHPHR